MLFLYRIMEIEDAVGNPMDHGLVRANDADHAKKLLSPHLKKIFGSGNVPVRLYTVHDSGLDGVVETYPGWIDTTVEF